ncbi:glycosyl hydrolase [Filimonas effusa]|uniref:beta-glucosidase n=2 Tax=Filimonas effusa TaxID=2508721 RepID=A0A4Q1D8C3_9BACT|nr:glycosyl hydrolase [Filimonas effusa]
MIAQFRNAVLAAASCFCLAGGAIAQHKTISQRVDSLMRLMTLKEKIGQLNQYSGKNVTGPVTDRNVNMLSDIKSGLVGSLLNVKGAKDTREIQAVALQSRLKIPLLFGLDVIHGYSTVFPIPLAESMSWDMDAIRLAAEVAAEETAAAGVHWTFAPMVDITRDPRWGRIMEGAGEDTYLGERIAKARVLGFQGERPGGINSVMACAKHFAAYGAVSAGRDYNDVEMSDHQLWETYLPPFKAAVDAGVATFMSSFNTINGIPAAAHDFLQRKVLKGDWGYNGFIVSDWGGIDQMIHWGYVADKYDAALKAMRSGCDMDMVSRSYLENLEKLVKEKQVAIQLVDDAVKRILYKKFELGLFEDPYRFCNVEREEKAMSNPRHTAAALHVAERSIVLLKNEKQLLPLQKGRQKIALIGALANAKRDLQGNWIPNNDTSKVVSIYEGLGKYLGRDANLVYVKGVDVKGADTSGIGEAVAVAAASDVVVMAIGETWDMSGESKSRAELSVPGQQEELFRRVYATGKPVIVIMLAGRPLVFNEIADKAHAIVYAWWPGNEGGNAIANVLFGKYNPSAKLTVTFPRSVGQVPLTYNGYKTGHPLSSSPNMLYKSGYIDMANTPRYAFGHGLSYTSFAYSELQLSKVSMQQRDSVILSVVVTNSGRYTGEEIVQLYISDPVASIVQPMKKLKGFRKLLLKPGESATVSFSISAHELSFYDKDLRWIAEPGRFKLMVGSASDDIRAQADLTLL